MLGGEVARGSDAPLDVLPDAIHEQSAMGLSLDAQLETNVGHEMHRLWLVSAALWPVRVIVCTAGFKLRPSNIRPVRRPRFRGRGPRLWKRKRLLAMRYRRGPATRPFGRKSLSGLREVQAKVARDGTTFELSLMHFHSRVDFDGAGPGVSRTCWIRQALQTPLIAAALALS
jgi:hypothetical protein